MASVAQIDGLNIPGGAPAFTGLLDETYGSGAAAAYSTRRLASATTVLLRVRRDTAGGTGDDDEADVTYDSNNELSLDSAISNASAGVTATTLGEFINVGTVIGTTYTNPDSLAGTASCHVKIWYDQAASLDAEQSTDSQQPQIHDGTVDTDLILENGKPSLLFDRTDLHHLLTSSSQWSSAGDAAFFSVYRNTSLSGAQEAWSNIATRWLLGSASQVYDGNSALFYTPPSGQRLLSYTHNSTSKDIYLDGSQVSTSSSPSTVSTSTSVAGIGRRYSSAELYAPMTIQDLIVYPNNQSGNRTAIEGNINSSYLIYQPTDAPTSGLLATYTGAAAAYSVRQLSNKAVICMRVRRDSDDEEINIGFDSNGDLATADIAAFCGTANGYVTRWWDQSVNGNHADQNTDTSQPQIYDGTAVLTENGKPALDFDGNDYLDASTGTVVQPFTIFQVFNLTRQGSFQSLYSGIGSRTSDATWSGSTLKIGVYSGTFNVNSSSDLPQSQVLMTNLHATTSVHRRDGTQYASGNAGTNNIVDFRIGALNSASFPFVGTMQSVIFYDSDQTSNFTGIESDINGYFSIT